MSERFSRELQHHTVLRAVHIPYLWLLGCAAHLLRIYVGHLRFKKTSTTVAAVIIDIMSG